MSRINDYDPTAEPKYTINTVQSRSLEDSCIEDVERMRAKKITQLQVLRAQKRLQFEQMLQAPSYMKHHARVEIEWGQMEEEVHQAIQQIQASMDLLRFIVSQKLGEPKNYDKVHVQCMDWLEEIN